VKSILNRLLHTTSLKIKNIGGVEITTTIKPFNTIIKEIPSFQAREGYLLKDNS